MARLVNRDDRCGGYWSGPDGVQPTSRPADGTKPGYLTRAKLIGHFRATGPDHVLGTYALGPDSFGRWLGIDFDAHDGTEADPDANKRFALAGYAELTGLGFRPLLYESNGKGGYHLRALFSDPVPGEVLFVFGRWLARCFAEFGHPRPPEVFPKQPRLDDRTKFGNWMRVVGRHHKRDFLPRVWDGSAWLADDAAVDHILTLTGDSAELIPTEAHEYEPEEARRAEAKKARPRTAAGEGSIFAQFNAAQTMGSVTALLQRHGWKKEGVRGDRWDFCRPGKAHGQSGNLMLVGGVPIFYGFTNASTVPEREGLNPAQLRAVLELGGTDKSHFAKLAKRLEEEGFEGPPRPPIAWIGRWRLPDDEVTRSEKTQPAPPAGVPPAGPAAAQPNGPLLGAEIILNFFRQHYRPVFRRGNAIRCRDGEWVQMQVATSVPDSTLIGMLAEAGDAPVIRGTTVVNRGALPGFFKTWSKVAWGDLLKDLPDEDGADHDGAEFAGEEFRRLVREALLTQIVLGEVIGKKDGPTQTERRSLIDWCAVFAKEGPWRSIRSLRCWCKAQVLPGGEIRLKVAVRHEVFAQLRADKRLCEMTSNTFTRRAARYGVGTSNRSDRPHGQPAVVLNDEFVAELTAGLHGDDPGEETPLDS